MDEPAGQPALLRIGRRCWPSLNALVAAIGLLWPGVAWSQVPVQLEQLEVRGRIYRNVEVRQVNARSLVFVHQGGLTSVALRDLSPELQARFDYSPEAEEAARMEAERQRERVQIRVEREHLRRNARLQEEARFDRLLPRLSDPPELRREVDLRSRFAGLGVKDQGRRPSCSVFAVVSALEYQTALLVGEPEKLSEEYLIWATRRVTQRPGLGGALETGETEVQDNWRDEGFSLGEVITALRAYGIPLQASMPNTFGSRVAAIAAPPPEVVEEARSRRRVYIQLLNSRETVSQIVAATHALNADVPVVIGVRWPHPNTLRAGVLTVQSPLGDYAHAVTLVGYTCATGRLEDAMFIFKNSYGVRWGQGGYGRVSFEYLRKNLLGAILLEVQRSESADALSAPRIRPD